MRPMAGFLQPFVHHLLSEWASSIHHLLSEWASSIEMVRMRWAEKQEVKALKADLLGADGNSRAEPWMSMSPMTRSKNDFL